MTAKEKKLAKEPEQLVIGIVHRMQGCDHVEAGTVAPDTDKGRSACAPGHANNSDVRRALLIAEADVPIVGIWPRTMTRQGEEYRPLTSSIRRRAWRASRVSRSALTADEISATFVHCGLRAPQNGSAEWQS